MRLIHCTDFHANRRWFKWVADHAEEYDLVVFSGDLLDFQGAESLATQVRWVTAWARSLPRPFLWCQGNHDTEIRDAPVCSGRWMTSLPGAKAFSQSDHAEVLGQSFVRVPWRGAIPQLRAGDVVLAHAPPAGCDTARGKGGGMDAGDMDLGDALRSAMAAPWMVLSGHAHAPTRWKDRCGDTYSLNPGVGANPSMPNFISIDTVTRKARWFKDGELADIATL
jgi:Icc-related predicted phosphoesterase